MDNKNNNLEAVLLIERQYTIVIALKMKQIEIKIII